MDSIIDSIMDLIMGSIMDLETLMTEIEMELMIGFKKEVDLLIEIETESMTDFKTTDSMEEFIDTIIFILLISYFQDFMTNISTLKNNIES